MVPAVQQSNANNKKSPVPAKQRSGQGSLYKCEEHGYYSNPDAPAESQKHGMEVHKYRSHGAFAARVRAKNTKKKNAKKQAGKLALQKEVIPGAYIKKPLNKAPKAFYDLKAWMIQMSAKNSGDAQDAYMHCASALSLALKEYEKK